LCTLASNTMTRVSVQIALLFQSPHLVTSCFMGEKTPLGALPGPALLGSDCRDLPSSSVERGSFVKPRYQTHTPPRAPRLVYKSTWETTGKMERTAALPPQIALTHLGASAQPHSLQRVVRRARPETRGSLTKLRSTSSGATHVPTGGRRILAECSAASPLVGLGNCAQEKLHHRVLGKTSQKWFSPTAQRFVDDFMMKFDLLNLRWG